LYLWTAPAKRARRCKIRTYTLNGDALKRLKPIRLRAAKPLRALWRQAMLYLRSSTLVGIALAFVWPISSDVKCRRSTGGAAQRSPEAGTVRGSRCIRLRSWAVRLEPRLVAHILLLAQRLEFIERHAAPGLEASKSASWTRRWLPTFRLGIAPSSSSFTRWGRETFRRSAACCVSLQRCRGVLWASAVFSRRLNGCPLLSAQRGVGWRPMTSVGYWLGRSIRG
jgi:hypothetical protein